jgi:predicted enzyme related to lactoylglutathione lyase
VLDREIDEVEMEDGPYGLFRTDDGEIGGAIARADEYTVGDNETKISISPGDSGTTIYLTVDGDLNDALSKVDQRAVRSS